MLFNPILTTCMTNNSYQFVERSRIKIIRSYRDACASNRYILCFVVSIRFEHFLDYDSNIDEIKIEKICQWLTAIQ